MCYSPDGEWLAGGKQIFFFYTHACLFLIYDKLGAADPAGHKIYIWDISNDGQLASALDGGREPLVHLHVNRLSRSIINPTNLTYFLFSFLL
jgi:COMPASS component SWD1